MKKLMFVAAAALAGSVFAEGEITSANIVGYQQVPVIPGFVLFAPTFTGVGDQELPLNDIKIVDATGTALAIGGEVTVQKMDDTGAYTDSFMYFDGMGWWGDTELTLKPGEALCANNGYMGTDGVTPTTVYFQISGQVDLVNKNAIAPGFVLWGNATPVDVAMNDVTVVDAEGTALAIGGEVTVQKMDDTGAYTDSFMYFDGMGWWGDTELTLKPGESVCANNGYMGTEGDTPTAVYFKVPSPVAE